VDPGHQLPGGERLGDVVVGPQLEAQHPVDLVVPGTEDQHRDPRGPITCATGPVTGPERLSPEPPAHVEAVEVAGQADVHDDQLRALPLHQGQAGLTVVGLQHPEPVTPQVHRHQIRYVVIVLDHHQSVLTSHHALQPAIGRSSSPVMVREV
jgi:hypothetical protein